MGSNKNIAAAARATLDATPAAPATGGVVMLADALIIYFVWVITNGLI